MSEATSLIERLEALEVKGDNFLDVQIEIALFRPHEDWVSIRANDAGTKVIFTTADGEDYTHWACDWSTVRNRSAAIASLKAQEASNE